MRDYQVISSTDNTLVKYVQSLHKKRVRYRERRYLIEGRRIVAQALESGIRPVFIFVAESLAATQDLKAFLAQWPMIEPVRVVSDALMALMVDTITPQGILAVLAMPELDLVRVQAADLVLVLDEIRDPGNLGTILRTAQATGVSAVLLTKGCVDPYAPKVVRAGMGGHWGTIVVTGLEWPEIEVLTHGKRVVLTEPNAAQAPWHMDLTQPLALVIGSEAEGVGSMARACAHESTCLPMSAGTESLNAAVATAAILFEVVRQRQHA